MLMFEGIRIPITLDTIIAVINSAVFIVMVISLIYQRQSLLHNEVTIKGMQNELQTMTLSLRIQVMIATLDNYHNQRNNINRTLSPENNEKYQALTKKIQEATETLEELNNQL